MYMYEWNCELKTEDSEGYTVGVIKEIKMNGQINTDGWTDK